MTTAQQAIESRMTELCATEFDDMTDAQRTELHALRMSLPSVGQMRAEARERIAAKIAARKAGV